MEKSSLLFENIQINVCNRQLFVDFMGGQFIILTLSFNNKGL